MWLLLSCISSYVFEHLEPAEPLPAQTLPEGLSSLSAKECGACHVAIYTEWSASQMGRAWTDPVFQVDFQEQGELYVCRNCHTPLVEQQPHLVVGLSSVKPMTAITEPNPHYQPELTDEGVTCVACHLEEGRIIGPYDDVDAPTPGLRGIPLPAVRAATRCPRRPSGSSSGTWRTPTASSSAGRL